jgi:hypothetical protein
MFSEAKEWSTGNGPREEGMSEGTRWAPAQAGNGRDDGGQVCRILFGDRLRPAAVHTYRPVCIEAPSSVSDAATR